MFDDRNNWIARSAQVHETATVEGSNIAQGAIIGENAVVVNSWIGPEAEVQRDAEVHDSKIAKRATVRPHAQLDDVVMYEEAVAGGNSILDNAHLKDRARVSSGTRIIDSVVGVDSRVRPETRVEGSYIGEGYRDSDYNQPPTPADVGAKCEIVKSHINDSTLQDGCTVRSAQVLGTGLRANTSIGPRSILLEVTGGEKLSVGDQCRITYTWIGNNVSIRDRVSIAGEPGRVPHIGNNSTLANGVNVFAGAVLHGDVSVGAYAMIRGRAEVGLHVRIGEDSVVGPESVVHPEVDVGENVTIDRDAVIERGATLGPHSSVRAAQVVGVNEVIEAHGVVSGAEGATSAEEVVPVTTTADAWVYWRLAEVAGRSLRERLDKGEVRRARPELLEHAITQDLLRMKPPPTAEELREMAEEADRQVKYVARIIPEGWRGLQRIGHANNDVIRFDVTSDFMEAVTGLDSDTPTFAGDLTKEQHVRKMAWGQLAEHIRSANVHDTAGADTLSWVRMVTYPSHNAILVEELQTDLPLLRKTMGKSLDKIDFDGLVNATLSYHGFLSPELLEESRQEQVEPPEATQELLAAFGGEEEYEEAYQIFYDIWVNFVVATHDLYETMLAFVLDWAKGRTTTVEGEPAGPEFDVEAVYVLTVTTKRGIQYAGDTPTFPYGKLYKRFQSAPKVKLPSFINVSDYKGDKPPQARLLRPNDPD